MVEKSTVTWLVGPPGCGKSTWVQNYLATATRETVVLNSDDLVNAWATEHGLTYTEAFEQHDWQNTFKLPCQGHCAIINMHGMNGVYEQIEDAFGHATRMDKDIIVDLANMKFRFCWGEQPIHYHTRAVVFEISRDLLEKRLRNRDQTTGKHIPYRVIENMIKGYVPVGEDVIATQAGYVTEYFDSVTTQKQE
jgi:predicted kinase